MKYVPIVALTAAQERAHREGRELTATELLLEASVRQMDPADVAWVDWCERMESLPEPGYETDAAGRYLG